MTSFIGFNTVGRLYPPFKLTDIELVKRDLLNHFTTRRGERVMNPEFGTIIYDLLMDPQDPQTRNALLQEARRVVNTEPRVQTVAIDVQEFQQSIIISLDLIFLSARVRDSLYIEYKTNIENSL